MPSNMQQAVLECDCCGGCTGGCCIPVDHSNPLYEPNGTPKNIPFCISAPNCAAIDGFCGEMLCGGAMPADLGGCGPCASCLGGFGQELPGRIYFDFPPPAGCVIDTCSLKICLRMACLQSTTPEPSLEACCRRFRLIIGCNIPIVGWTEELEVQGCRYWKYVAPTVCVCNPDANAMPAIVWDLGLTVDCATPPCDGHSTCCELFDCSLVDAQVIV